MKSSVRVFLFGAAGVALLSLAAYATSYACGYIGDGELELNSHKVQVVHGKTYNSDTTTMTLDITNHGDPSCDTNDDLINGGLDEIALSGCSCEQIFYKYSMLGPVCMICTEPFEDDIPSFVLHTIAGHRYGTFYSLEPDGVGPGTLSAKATALTIPMGACGRWTLNLTATGLDLSSITQSSPMNPIALLIKDGDGSSTECFDITDAVVGPVVVH